MPAAESARTGAGRRAPTPISPWHLLLARCQGLRFDVVRNPFFVGRRTIKPAAKSAMPLWQDDLISTAG